MPQSSSSAKHTLGVVAWYWAGDLGGFWLYTLFYPTLPKAQTTNSLVVQAGKCYPCLQMGKLKHEEIQQNYSAGAVICTFKSVLLPGFLYNRPH